MSWGSFSSDRAKLAHFTEYGQALIDDESLARNAIVLSAELDWFVRVLDARLKLQFSQDSPCGDVTEIEPPCLEPTESIYGCFVHHYGLSFAERVILVLSLIPHIRPQLLDVFLTRNEASDRHFTEFGGRNSHSFPGFLPTGETGLFVLCGDDLQKRLLYSQIFDPDHTFSRHGILALESPTAAEPHLSGFLTLNREIVDMLTIGSVRRPCFGPDFPAKFVTSEMAWEDLVLDPYTMGQVLEIKIWIEHGDELLYGLGLGKRIRPGYRALFHGPSGTGKTLTATLLGKATSKDVYRIDLSLVVSKYIGETEKNLEKVFKRAEHKSWILFFDEADALFGKRTKISDAHDRFANQEVSYLLQRVEDYTGVVILASNLKSNIDEAFTRRFQSIVYFPMPGRAERLRLWNDAFSDKTPREDKVDLSAIAAQYEVSGGTIMNVVRYATLMALARGGRIIRHDDLLAGIRREFHKDGKTL